MLKGRFLKGEDTIATNAHYSYLYARDVLKGPFSEGENAIATNADCSYAYAKDVIKGRFIKGEPAIMNSQWKTEYLTFINELKK
ncbi:MAG: hypothetical protein ACXW2E_00010 [Nitrososphaeraceae archaeon]